MSGYQWTHVFTLQCSEAILEKGSNCVLEVSARPTWRSLMQRDSSSQGVHGSKYKAMFLLSLWSSQTWTTQLLSEMSTSNQIIEIRGDSLGTHRGPIQWFLVTWKMTGFYFDPITEQVPGQAHKIIGCLNLTLSRKTCLCQVTIICAV